MGGSTWEVMKVGLRRASKVECLSHVTRPFSSSTLSGTGYARRNCEWSTVIFYVRTVVEHSAHRLIKFATTICTFGSVLNSINLRKLDLPLQ